MSHDDTPLREEDVRQRLVALETENARLRNRVEEIDGPTDPAFDVREFQKALQHYLMIGMIPLHILVVGGVLASVFFTKYIPHIDLLPGFPLIDPGGMYSRHPGFGVGAVAFGGLAIGIIALGGGAIGVLAVGGGALGVFAFGGGAVGIVALGGGAAGYVAIGGGGFGRYVLAGDGRGKYVFSRRRRDAEAIEFFTRYLPRLRRACTGPMPIVSGTHLHNHNETLTLF